MFNKSTIIHFKDFKIDLFKYIDENSDFLKKEYLKIVFNISNLEINNQSLKKSLEYKGHSLWEMSLINEKNIYKNNGVFKTIKYLALKKILHENVNREIRIFFLEKDLENILKKEFKNENIKFYNSNFTFRENLKKILFKNKIYNYIYFLYFFIKN